MGMRWPGAAQVLHMHDFDARHQSDGLGAKWFQPKEEVSRKNLLATYCQCSYHRGTKYRMLLNANVMHVKSMRK